MTASYFADRMEGQLRGASWLRLEPVQGGPRVELPLSVDAGSPDTMLDPHPGHVLQASRYQIMLIVPEHADVEFAAALLTVNGDEIECVRRGRGVSTLLKDNVVMHGIEIEPVEAATRPFGLVWGYARLQLELRDERGQTLATLTAREVRVQQDAPVDNDNVGAMVDAIMEDPVHSQALRWMLSDGTTAQEQTYSLVEGGYSARSNRSVPTYLTIVENGLDAAEAALPLLRSHAASRIQHREHVLDAQRVRKIGSPEMQWIVAHPEHLRPADPRRCVIAHQGRSYTPARVSTSQTFRSFDVYENRLCLAFLATAASRLADFEAKLQRNVGYVNPPHVENDDADPSHLLLVAVARAVQGRQRQHLGKAAALRKRALRLLRLYERVLPGVQKRSLGDMGVIRTKTFKEIRAYSQIFQHIERFARCGERLGETDGLAIAALRLDKVYETYVLYRLLDWLWSNGFVLDDTVADPVYAGKYGHTSPVHDDAPHMANVYHLKRGTTKLSLYYEPVVFVDGAREEHGVTLHRLNGRTESVYLPDFVLVIGRAAAQPTDADDELLRFADDGKRVYMLDAKYRPTAGLLRRYRDDAGGESPAAFETCVKKYLMNCIDAQTGKLPDALWLLSGLAGGEEEAQKIPAFPWDARHAPAFPSGIAPVTPQHDLDDLFDALGIAPSPGTVRRTAKQAAPEAENPSEGLPSPASPSSAKRTADDGRKLRESSSPETQEQSASRGGLANEPADGPDAASETDTADTLQARKPARQVRLEKQQKLKLAAAKAKQAKREEKIRRRREAAQKRSEAGGSTGAGAEAGAETSAKSAATANENAASLEEITLAVIDAFGERGEAPLFEAAFCRSTFGIDRPLLRKRPSAHYLPVPNCDDAFYFAPKLPTHRAKLKRFLKKRNAKEI